MINFLPNSDKLAISLSLLCAVHCLALPLILLLLPGLTVLNLDNEAFHQWMLVAVIPTSVYALTMGCKKHKRFQFLIIGFIGLSLLIAAVVIGESILGEFYEKMLTLAGVSIVAIGHFMNFRLCHQQHHCNDLDCHNH